MPSIQRRHLFSFLLAAGVASASGAGCYGGAAGDGGSAGGGGTADSGPDPWSAPVGCASGAHYVGGANSRMEPGVACVSCHTQSGEGPVGILGTAYASAHDEDRCNGIAGSAYGDAYISVLDDQHVEVAQLPINAVGNFMGNEPASATYYVALVANGQTREMAMAVPSGDCNSCHTQDGAVGAPGRILVP